VPIRQVSNLAQVLGLLRNDVERLGSQKALAEAIGIGAPYLSDVLKGNRDPGPSILKFYGLREESVYVPDEVVS
jgi:transcriptional regulator with XRE-family HTH domain